LSVYIIIFSLTGSQVTAAGFREVTTEDVKFGVWYPSDTAGEKQKFGPFETTMAKDSPIRVGKHQLVLFSHGVGGRYRNHYLTAQTLADAGYIVIAPDHQADYLIGGQDTAAALDYRYFELMLSLNAVRNNADFNPYIKSGPVHGVGYSLGGFTIMLAAGAGLDLKKRDLYCEKNGFQDPEFCEEPGMIYRFLQSFSYDVNLRPTTDQFQHEPIVTGKAVLIAPVYQGLTIGTNLSLTNLTVISITGDTIAKPIFHALPLKKNADTYVKSKLESIEGHHFAFIAPFPKRLEDIPVAKDPKGFDRPAFLNTVNKMILKSLKTP